MHRSKSKGKVHNSAFFPDLSVEEWKALSTHARAGNLPKLRAAVANTAAVNPVDGASEFAITFARRTLRRLATRAAQKGHRDLLEYLCLERGVKVNALTEGEKCLWAEQDHEERIEDSECTPLVAAMEAQDEDLATFLLELHRRQEQQEQERPRRRPKGSGLDVNRRMDEDRTILQVAVFCELPLVAKALLLEHGANLFAKDVRGHCALCTATFKCHMEMLNIFLTHCREKG